MYLFSSSWNIYLNLWWLHQFFFCFSHIRFMFVLKSTSFVMDNLFSFNIEYLFKFLDAQLFQYDILLLKLSFGEIVFAFLLFLLAMRFIFWPQICFLLKVLYIWISFSFLIIFILYNIWILPCFLFFAGLGNTLFMVSRRKPIFSYIDYILKSKIDHF